ncbi:D-arabinono-1,4-lactone oxidase [Tessaracoccus terricola]
MATDGSGATREQGSPRNPLARLRRIPRERDFEFRNWSGSMSFTARTRARPRDEDDVVHLVRRAAQSGQVVRPVGSGHSSTPLVATDDVLVSLEDLSGVLAHDSDAGTATVGPGTGLADLGRELHDVGLALENYGDVDYQAIAGALGTGTHGTGERLGNLSSNLVGGRLVTGSGEVVAFGVDGGEPEDSDLVRAAQVSLGALGIWTSLTLRVVPAYELHRQNFMTHVDWVLEHFDELAARYRHVDFYWYPRSDEAQVRVLDEPGRLAGLEVEGTLKTEQRGHSYDILPNSRDLRFDEMEFMFERAHGLEVFREVRERVKQRHRRNVGWRVLVRTVAPDAAMLSNAHHRDTMTIALLQNAELPHEAYFADMEPLFLAHDGRPHWGKKHTRVAADLRPMYPEWDRFGELRRELDPEGVFLGDYLRELLDPDAPPRRNR